MGSAVFQPGVFQPGVFQPEAFAGSAVGPAGGPTLDPNDALQQRILDATEFWVRDLGLATPAGPVWVNQPEIVRWEKVEFPCVVVTDQAMTETVRSVWNGSDVIGFPVMVLMLFRDGDDTTKRLLKKWREMISLRFRYQRLDGVPEVMSCEPEYGSIVDLSVALTSEGQTTNLLLKASQMVLRFIARQTRGV